MKGLNALILLIIVSAACQTPPNETPMLPTLVEFPTVTATETATEPPTALPTRTSTATPTATYTPSQTLRPSLTPTDTPTATRTPDLERAQAASATAAILEAPRFSTFTPAPAGARARPTSTGTPQVMADVVINEAQFQEEVTLKIADMPNVDRAVVDLTPEGIVVTLTIVGDDGALTTGDLIIFVNSQDGLAVIQGALALDEDDPEPSETFLTFATGDFFLEMVDVIDIILDQRLGEMHNLETVTLTDDAMLISLLVPLPSTP